MSQALLDPLVTIADFDEFLRSQNDDELWELVEGRIVGMTNPTEFHEQIVGNIGAPLKQAMDVRDCRVYFGGMRVQRSDDSHGVNKPRPDLLVRCGAASAHNYVKDPLVIVEVLSRSTIDMDRGEKLRFYKGLPTLRHIVLVYQDQVRVEHYRRSDMGWEVETLTQFQNLLCFEAVRFELTLKEVYFAAVPGEGA